MWCVTLTISKRSEELLQKAYCNVNAKRSAGKLKIRVSPYVEIKHKDEEELLSLRYELLNLSIGSTVRIKSEKQPYSFIRIHGIQNCNLILPYINSPVWWREAMVLFINKEHCQREGVQKIIELRPNVRNSRFSNQEIVDLLMDFD